MASPQTFDAFHDRLVQEWNTTPLVFENEFAQDLIDIGVPAFVFVEIVGDTYDQDTMGAPGQNTFLETGITFLHVMTPAGKGSRLGRVHADALIRLFRELPIGELFMPQFSIGAGDPGQDFANYYSTAATIRWYRRDATDVIYENV